MHTPTPACAFYRKSTFKGQLRLVQPRFPSAAVTALFRGVLSRHPCCSRSPPCRDTAPPFRIPHPRTLMDPASSFHSLQTSLIRRYTDGVFTPNYKLTIGVDFAVKAIQREDGSTVNLQLWYARARRQHSPNSPTLHPTTAIPSRGCSRYRAHSAALHPTRTPAPNLTRSSVSAPTRAHIPSPPTSRAARH